MSIMQAVTQQIEHESTAPEQHGNASK